MLIYFNSIFLLILYYFCNRHLHFELSIMYILQLYIYILSVCNELLGSLFRCGAEYLDIYAEVQSSDPADLINSPFGGRYCGPIPPRRRISLYRAVALSFFTSKNATTAELFTGRYSFVNACEYIHILIYIYLYIYPWIMFIFPSYNEHILVVGQNQIKKYKRITFFFSSESSLRNRYAGQRFGVLLHDNAAQKQVGHLHFAHVSRCLSEGHVVLVSVHRRTNATRSTRVPRFRSVFWWTTVSRNYIWGFPYL